MDIGHCRACACECFAAQYWRDNKCKECFHTLLDHSNTADVDTSFTPNAAGLAEGGLNGNAAPEIKERRDYIVKEILTTEQTYVDNLSAMLNLYLESLRAIPVNIISPDMIVSIFSNAGEILPLNRQLLSELQNRWSNWSPTQTIGDVFLNLIPFFKTYTNYTAGYSEGLAVLKELEKNSLFVGVLNKCSSHRKTTLESLLITPVQRIPRYNLLLTDLIKHTDPSHPDYSNLQQCLQKMRSVADSINEAIRHSENRKKVLEIQKSLLPADSLKLVEPHRMFVRQGSLWKVCRKSNKKFTFFLFSDLFLYADPVGDRFHFHRMIPLETCRFEDKGPTPNGPEHSFVIVSAKKSFAVFADTQGLKDEWLSDLLQQSKLQMSRMESFRSRNSTREIESSSEIEAEVDVEAPVWATDDSAKACVVCSEEFGLFFRRHHCRLCGHIVCAKCSDKKLRIISLDSKNDVRVCVACYQKRRPLDDKSKLKKSGSVFLEPAQPLSSSQPAQSEQPPQSEQLTQSAQEPVPPPESQDVQEKEKPPEQVPEIHEPDEAQNGSQAQNGLPARSGSPAQNGSPAETKGDKSPNTQRKEKLPKSSKSKKNSEKSKTLDKEKKIPPPVPAKSFLSLRQGSFLKLN